MKIGKQILATLSCILALSMPITAQASGNYAADADYSEWVDVPHTIIEYNTWDEYDDALSALYSQDGYCYFHVYSPMPAHLAEGGGEFTSGITVLFNNDYNTAFYPRFVLVDDAGNLTWDPQLVGLPHGTYHFYLCSTDAWHTSTNIDELNNMDLIYGEAYITLAENRDDMEWRLDLNKVANKFGVSSDELKTIAVQYSRLGQQWTISAGTPTGSAVSVILCFTASIIGIISYSTVIATKKTKSCQI